MSVRQKLGMILENKVVQKLEINVFNKKVVSKLDFFPQVWKNLI